LFCGPSTPEIYTLSLHDALPISTLESRVGHYYQMEDTYLVGREKVREFARAVQDYHPAHWNLATAADLGHPGLIAPLTFTSAPRSEEHTSELQSRENLVCRLLLE